MEKETIDPGRGTVLVRDQGQEKRAEWVYVLHVVRRGALQLNPAVGGLCRGIARTSDGILAVRKAE